jgi:hypothetical protein
MKKGIAVGERIHPFSITRQRYGTTAVIIK